MKKLKKVNWFLHHQAVVDCPKCKAMIVEDLGEFPDATGIIIECPQCRYEFEIGDMVFEDYS